MLARLKGMGFVLDDSEDEDVAIEGWFAKIAQDKSIMRATVLTTYDCNFACPYCVEAGVTAPIYMGRETAACVVEYVRRRIEKDNPKRLVVDFYGGEPLMNLKAIRIVARELKTYCGRREVAFTAGMSTNGSLLTPKVVDVLTGCGLTTAKITLDGTREAHNLRRPHSNGQGSFDTIIENVRAAADKMSLDIGGNFDEENVDSLVDLLDYLKELGLASKIRRVRFKPISQTLRDREGVVGYADLGCVYYESGVMESMLRLRRAIIERGFNTDPGVGMNICGITMNGLSYTIDPQGKLFQCGALVGREEFCVGEIGKDEALFKPAGLWKRCIDCEYVPLCGDGCIHAALVRYGDHTKLNCDKEFMEYMVKETLKLNYELCVKEAG